MSTKPFFNGAVGAVVVAAGRGERMGGEKKQFRLLGDKPVFVWSVEAITKVPFIDRIVVVTGEDDVAQAQHMVARYVPEGLREAKGITVTAGGDSRQQSVWLGLQALGNDVRWVVVHDGVRPFVTAAAIEEVLVAAEERGAAIAAVPVKDTIKYVDVDGIIEATPDRNRLWAAQTPQAFAMDVLVSAHREAVERGEGDAYTDDSSLVEAAGVPVVVVPSSDHNVKLTTERDFQMAESEVKLHGRHKRQLPEPSVETVTGFGFDVHRLEPGRALVLGGVTVDHKTGLAGHSDADVLTHAVMDALLGAMTLGDIGRHYPDTDPQYAGADSIALLQDVCNEVAKRGGEIVHVDAFLSAERPKLSPLIDRMRQRLADAMAISVDRVNVKAGTGERRGPVGREEVMEARVVATVRRQIKLAGDP